MLFTIQQNWSEPEFLTFGQRIMLIVGVFLVLFIISGILTAKKRNTEEDGEAIYNVKDILGLNKPFSRNEDRKSMNDFPSPNRPSIFQIMIAVIIVWLIIFIGISL